MSFNNEIDVARVPRHVAIIMDGNGRWAKAKGLPRTAGHQEGVETVKKITEEAVRLGVKYLTLYTFSTENWSRPVPEIAALMGLILDHLEDAIFMKNNVRFRAIGDMSRIPEIVQERLKECMRHTAGNDAMTMVIALSYSSRWELTQAMRRIACEVKQNTRQPEQITEATIQEHLSTNFMPDPDLLIRTGGEFRISNYLLWQCAYTEFYFCDTYWPDFDEKEFDKAIADYQARERRFGKTSEQVAIK
ncbi:MAG: isoprenyl transferase [Paraprevotella sp.]|nr:isoprenyl transferase [Paraprevotella sp.]